MRSEIFDSLGWVEYEFLPADSIPPQDLAVVHQVHGTELIEVKIENATLTKEQRADGLFTSERNLPVGIQTADCIPALFVSTAPKIVAAVHAGWRGVLCGILPKTVKRFVKMGVRSSDIRVLLGPSIGPCCFEVGQDVAESFSEIMVGKKTDFLYHSQPQNTMGNRSQAPSNKESIWLDLRTIARTQLEECGVLKENLGTVGQCTYCGPPHFESYRRATHAQRKAGRQWSWIRIRSTP